MHEVSSIDTAGTLYRVLYKSFCGKKSNFHANCHFIATREVGHILSSSLIAVDYTVPGL